MNRGRDSLINPSTPNQAKREQPRGWRQIKLGEISEIISGQSPPSFTYRKEPVGLPFFQGKADFGAKSPVARIYCVSPKKIAFPGDILISVRAPVGPTNVADVKCSIGRGLAAIRCGEEADRDFVLSFLKLYEKEISQMGTGSTFGAINRDHLLNLEIPLPPLAEQKRIVAVLNEQMVAVEKARVAALEKVEAVRALASVWLREVFSFSDVNLPRGWRWTTLGEIATAFRGVNFSSGEGQPTPEKGYTACLTTSGVQDTPDWSSRRFIPSERIKSDSQLLSVGDIMISTANSKALVGKSCLISDVPYECAFGAFVTVIRLSNQTTPEWISHTIRTDQAKRFFYEKSSRTTNISNLKVSALLEMPIPLPPLTEQKRLISALSAKIATAEKARAAAEAELEDITALPSALLRQAFSGAL